MFGKNVGPEGRANYGRRWWGKFWGRKEKGKG